MLAVADFALTLVHTLVVLFNLIGWAVPWLQRLHLLVISLTFASWFVLGIWYGWGYCFLTDWAWQIKEARGATDLPHSFIEWMLENATGLDWNTVWVDVMTVVSGILAFALSVRVNLRRH